MSDAKTFPSLAGLFCDVAACRTLYRLFDRPPEGGAPGTGLIPWLLLTLAVYGADRIFLRRARVLPAVVAFHILLLGGHTAVLLLFFSDLQGFAAYLMAGLMILFTGGRACARCFTPPTAMHSIRQLEACVAILLAAVWFHSLVALDSSVCLPIAAAVGIAFSALIAQRLEGARGASSGSAPSGLVTLGLVLLALSVVMLLFMLFVSAPVGEGVLWLWHAGTAAARRMLGLLYRLLAWLAYLLPDPGPGEEPYLEPYTFELPEPEEETEADPLVGAVMAGLLICGVVLLLIRLLWRLRALRVGGSQRRGSSRQAVTRSRPRLLTLLRRAFSALRHRIRLAFVQFCRRNTPAGVCAAIERHGRLLGAGRGRGETHCAYLRRIARLTCGQDPGLPAELDRLAELLERGFYGGEPMPALAGKTARGLRRRAFLALRRRLLPDADTLSRIKRRLPAGWSRH